MASSRGKPRNHPATGRRVSRQVRDRTAAAKEQKGTSNPYEEMLEEAAQESQAQSESRRPIKRRRIDHGTLIRDGVSQDRDETTQNSQRVHQGARNLQVVYDDSDSSEGSDIDWEEVEIDDSENVPAEMTQESPSGISQKDISDITIDLGKPKEAFSRGKSSKKLSASVVEKKKRLDIHKIHLCCLLVHAAIRNSWCNDESVHAALKPIFNRKTVSLLNPDVSISQFQQTRSFVEGLEQACQTFRLSYTITTRGLKRCTWSSEPLGSDKRRLTPDTEGEIDKKRFGRTATSREGSRDVGVQLFCALLRAVGVDARLVCSLQPLPFANPAPAPASNLQHQKPTFELHELAHHIPSEEMSSSDVDRNTSDDHGDSDTALRRVRRFGASHQPIDYGKAPPVPARRKKIVESNYPVYWIEAFNAAHQKWISVDPFATRTVGRPNKLEPPASDSSNSMSYVVAFEDDGTAKDVTRRYVKAYNAKTRRARVEITSGGVRWWKQLMKQFRSSYQADRDQVEDAELVQKEASEPMPRNVQDFKDHPYYALERHLRRNETIHPKKEVGKLSATKASDVVEPIYRRQDVQIVKPADKWYREGREILQGEQPLKYNTPNVRRQKRSVSPSSDYEQGDEEDNNRTIGLYAKFQTQIYTPMPVDHGKIHKNAYGNLDVYAETMIPAGGAHIRAVEAAHAAKMVGVDYADAVTGFKFKGRKGTAISLGVIVAIEYVDAVVEVIKSMRFQAMKEQATKQHQLALALWKRFLIALRIQERIAGYEDDATLAHSDGNDMEMKEAIDEEIEREEVMQEEGGFIPEARSDETAQPTAAPLRTGSPVIPKPQTISLTDIPQTYDDTVTVTHSPWDLQIKPKRQNDPGNPPKHTSEAEALRNSEEHGGGFLVEAEQQQDDDLFESASEHGGGGFIIPGQSNKMEIDPEPETSNERGNDAGGFVVEQASKTQPKDVHQSAGEDGLRIQEDETAEGTERREDLDAVRFHIHGHGPDHDPNDNDEDEDADDQTSLLSHDPEDEEAEPDWL